MNIRVRLYQESLYERSSITSVHDGGDLVIRDVHIVRIDNIGMSPGAEDFELLAQTNFISLTEAISVHNLTPINTQVVEK